jgi:hypothetical protein
MKYITPLEDFHPQLQPILKEFARKSHAVNLEVMRPDFIIEQGQTKPEYKTAIFIDPRFPKRMERRERVGYVKFSYDAPIEVGSRLIKNEKYRRHSLEYNTKASKIESKVVKMMVDFLKPFSFSEIFEFNSHLAENLVKGWHNELYKAGESMWHINSAELYEEVKHLRDLGVQFKTDEFRKLAEAVETRDAYKARQKQNIEVYHVYVVDGRVAVTAKELDKYAAHNYKAHYKPTVMYDSIETLPEDLLADVSMLKILGGDANQSIPGVGHRVSDNEFYVMKPLASNTNA